MTRYNMLQFLHAAVVFFYLLLPSMLCDNLLCYYSPVLVKDATFDHTVTVCPPKELCFKADGRFGNRSDLIARGCMAKKDCSQVHSVRLNGVMYNITYNCCDQPYCNSCPGVKYKSLYIILTLVTAFALGS